MSKLNRPVMRKDEIVIQEVDVGEVLVYDLRRNSAFCLNETSALIWRACDGSRDVAELSNFISDRLNVTANEDIIWLALEQLKKKKLLENVPESDGRFEGMTRREVIRKVGVGASIAIPVIAGLVAPPAYASASACGVSYTMACACPNGNGPGNPCTAAVCAGGTNPNCRCIGVACNPSGNNCVGTCG